MTTSNTSDEKRMLSKKGGVIYISIENINLQGQEAR